jgi:hypothetical protein
MRPTIIPMETRDRNEESRDRKEEPAAEKKYVAFEVIDAWDMDDEKDCTRFLAISVRCSECGACTYMQIPKLLRIGRKLSLANRTWKITYTFDPTIEFTCKGNTHALSDESVKVGCGGIFKDDTK